MKVKDGFILRKVISQYVVVATGDTSKNFHGMLRLNDEAAFAFELLKEDTTEEQLVSALLEKYPADAEETKASVREFISKLKEADVIDDPIHLSEYDSLIREVLASGGEFRLYPHGSSMLPLIRQGQDSVVLRTLDRPPKAKDILFYQRRDGSYVLHRVKADTPDGITLWGDNQTVLEHGITEDQIIGYAARIFRDDTEVNCRSFWYRAYLWLWCFMAIRRPMLWLAHHLRKGG